MGKKILLIATGGTIASKPSTLGGLSPKIRSRELISYVPELQQLCDLHTEQLFHLDSTNMEPGHWLELAQFIRSHYDAYDGFVVSHGTDTMAYAVAMVSYLIQNSPKPILFTGAQRSIYERDTDARNNLYNAVLFACDDRASGVNLVFDGKVITGTRARKSRTKSFNAFSSIDYPPIAVIRGGKIRFYIQEPKAQAPTFYDRIDTEVFVLRLTPGMKADIFDFIAKSYHAVIIESFGMGGIPYYENEAFADKIEMLVQRGIQVIMTTQVEHEGSDMEVYSVGYRIKKKYELLEAYDMTSEAVLAKTMWALGLTREEEQFRKLFLTPVGKDLV